MDLKSLYKWLRANKISLNASKTEILIFRNQNKQLTVKNETGQVVPFELRIKLDGKMIKPSSYVKYLGILMDEHLKWNFHINELSTKLSRAAGMLTKIRHYVSSKCLTMIYHGIFSSLLHYSSQIWGQSSQIQKCIAKIQDKAMRIMTFKHKRYPVTNLYGHLGVLKFEDHIQVSNFLFAHDNITNNLPKSLCGLMSFVKDKHHYLTRNHESCLLNLPSVRTKSYGSESIHYKSIVVWNIFVKTFINQNLAESKRNYCKSLLKKYFIAKYV